MSAREDGPPVRRYQRQGLEGDPDRRSGARTPGPKVTAYAQVFKEVRNRTMAPEAIQERPRARETIISPRRVSGGGMLGRSMLRGGVDGGVCGCNEAG